MMLIMDKKMPKAKSKRLRANNIHVNLLFMKHLSIFIILCIMVGCGEKKPRKTLNEQEKVASVIRRSNIINDSAFFQTGIPHIPLLVSNGIVGGCFDHMGFQSRPNTGMPHGRTVFGYIRHYDQHESSRQIQFPLAIIRATFADGSSILNLMDIKNYSQELDLYTGTLTTSYDLHGPTTIKAFAHQTIPSLFIMKIDRKPESKNKQIVLHIDCETSEEQNNDFGWPVDPVRTEFQKLGNSVLITSTTDLTETMWVVHSNNKLSVEGNSINIPLKEQENTIRIWVKRDDCPGISVVEKPYDKLYASHVAEWKNIWQTSWISFPEDRAQHLWTRMKYYALSHFPVIAEKPMIPSGLNSNIWGFTFPQDVYYVAENLPRLGHLDRAEKALQYWLEALPDVKKYSKRIMGIDGGYYPWTPPYEQWENYEKNGAVGADSYELHNPAYVAAMVWHYFEISNDTAFLEKYFPVLEEVWRFYAQISSQNEKGQYDIYHEHARGQDEASSTAGRLKNLLCASYSAEYTARNYLKAIQYLNKYDAKLATQAQNIMDAGYERDALLCPEGFYSTYEGDDRPLNSQKHPVQINPLAYLPMPDLASDDSPVKVAWQKRYQLTKKAKKPLTLGWTIGEFALASCRMKDPGQLQKDLSAIQPCHGADPRWIQFYESSFWTGWHYAKAYYFPMHALYLQTFTGTVVQDWRGHTEIFPCLLPQWKNDTLQFHGIRTKAGVEINGSWHKGKINIELIPHKTREITLSIAQPIQKLKAKGQHKGPVNFNGNQKVTFVFKGNNPIFIKN